MKKTDKKWSQKTPEELEAVAAEFSRFIPLSETKPLTHADKRQHMAARKRGRPRIGQGADKIQISVEHGLLMQVDRVAEELNLSRSEIIARGLRAVLALSGK